VLSIRTLTARHRGVRLSLKSRGTTMTEYVILLPGDESVWERASAADKEAMYAIHRQFAQALEERGHKVTGGAELTSSREARVLHTDAEGNHTVTEGPYAETVEQLTGFYVVESDDLDDLVDVCKILGRGEGAIEIRAAVSGPSS
jgi:hypothetical protein